MTKILCQICDTFKEARGFTSYKHECKECRRARRKLAKEGVSLSAMKEYLAAVGIKTDFPVVDKEPEPAVSIDFARKKKGDHDKPQRPLLRPVD